MSHGPFVARHKRPMRHRNLILQRRNRPLPLYLTNVPFLLQPAPATRRARTRRFTGNHNFLLLLQPLCHPLESHLAVGVLRPPLGRCHNDSTRAMQQPHPCLDFIAVLTSRSTGDEELHVTVTFQRFTVSRISLLSHQKVPIIRLQGARQTRTVSSKEPEATSFPSRDQLTERTPPLWPLKVKMGVPSAELHICTVLSSPPEAIYFPFGDHATV